MKKYYIKTFGCAMNQADSEKINMILLQSGFIKINNGDEADLIIFNTCSVRQKGEDRVFGLISDFIKNREKTSPPTPLLTGEGSRKTKKLVIGITGCMVRKTGLNEKYLTEEKDRKRAKKIELLKDSSDIFNNDDKLFPRLKKLDFSLRIEEIKYLPLILTKIFDENIGKEYLYDDYLKTKQLRDNPASASIIIQTGCDNYCTYCIVPHTRGREISREQSEIIDEIKEAINSGAKEITLIGQNVNSYGKQFKLKDFWDNDLGKWKSLQSQPFPQREKEVEQFKSPFRYLLEEIDKIEGIERLRFISSNPHDMTDDILNAHFELKNTCNYLHFALQSGSNQMLKKMNRKHSYEDFKKMVDFLRAKDPLFSVSTDIIVGYSGETEEMFEETLKAVRECEFDFVYNARYSVRKGTIAAKLFPDDVPDNIKAERWHKLNDLLKENIQKRNELMLGRTEKVLINGIKEGAYIGRTRNFKEVHFESENELKIGDLVEVELKEIEGFIIKGEKKYF